MGFGFSDDDTSPETKKLVGVANLDSRNAEFESAWYLYYADLPSLGAAESRSLHIEPIQLYSAVDKDAFERCRENVRERVKKSRVPTSL